MDGLGARRELVRLAVEIGRRHGGVAHRRELREIGVREQFIRSEVTRGSWHILGRHTVAMVADVRGEALAWRAVWESGSGAVLGGASALVAAGMSGFALPRIDICVPATTTRWPTTPPGVAVRRVVRMPRTLSMGLPRINPVHATIQAAQWATTDRQAALLIALSVQQRLVHPRDVLTTWGQVRYSPRRVFLDAVLRDVCDGAQSLGELDFATWCRRAGLPAPSRQVVKQGPKWRIYLDAEWEHLGLAVEIDGAAHQSGLATVDDALRQNSRVLDSGTVLRIPVLGLRLEPERFMAQVVAAYRALSVRSAGQPMSRRR